MADCKILPQALGFSHVSLCVIPIEAYSELVDVLGVSVTTASLCVDSDVTIKLSFRSRIKATSRSRKSFQPPLQQFSTSQASFERHSFIHTVINTVNAPQSPTQPAIDPLTFNRRRERADSWSRVCPFFRFPVGCLSANFGVLESFPDSEGSTRQ